MKISVITPTADRGAYLEGLYTLLKRQTHTDWEWLIYDTSARPHAFSDPQVYYHHSNALVSIGEKRNHLFKELTGDAIVQCDDDDYYAPTYLETVIRHLQKASFVHLQSWFTYDLKTKQMFYRAMEEEQQTRYVVNALSGSCIREVDFDEKSYVNTRQAGYGFSYAYRREVIRQCAYSDLDLKEDLTFFRTVEEAGFPMCAHHDQNGEAIHLIHEMNTSSDYPQYRIPRFLVEERFADFFTYLSPFYEG
ncbi:MAG: hypothetical protein S4CHLAM2_17570 [Chlamydiales bacterium]|nr:hypothetical protein [Chlamydiales bacterium]